MTKVALLTIWREKNYGAELQAYATVRALRNLGVDVEVIDFRLSDQNHETLKTKVIKLISSFSPETREFKKFWLEHIPSGKHYRTLEDLRNDPPLADMYLVGSDQVWNPEITKNKAPAYFLDFGEDNIKRASYASSFGTKQWKGNQALSEIAKERLDGFLSISCREKSGVEILRKTFGIQSQCVLDPCLLHTNFDELTGKVEQQNNLVYYPLVEFKKLEEFSLSLANDLHLNYVNANKKTFLIRKIVWKRPSIIQWIRDIAGASFVVTPSFHGLALSLIYHKQFIIFENTNCSNRSSRVLDLLTELNLTDRYFSSFEALHEARPWERKIDFNEVDKRLSALRKESLAYLNRIIL